MSGLGLGPSTPGSLLNSEFYSSNPSIESLTLNSEPVDLISNQPDFSKVTSKRKLSPEALFNAYHERLQGGKQRLNMVIVGKHN